MPLIIAVAVLLLVAFCVVMLWLPYYNAASTLSNEPMQIEKQANGSVILSWPVAENCDRYLVKVSDAANAETVYLEKYYTDNVCTLPELPAGARVSLSVHSVKAYKMLWVDMERMCQNPLEATTLWELPDLEQVIWKADENTKTAKLSYQKKSDARCKLYAKLDNEWVVVQDSQGSSVIVQFGEGSIIKIPPVGQEVQFRAVAYRQEENLIFLGQTFDNLTIQRDDFLGRNLNPVFTDNGYNVCTITWDETKGERYQVQLWDGKEDEWVTLAEVPWDGERSYTSPHMAVNKTFRYRVVALGGQVIEGSEFAAVSQQMEQVTKESPIYCTVWANQEIPVYANAQKTEELGKIKAGSAWCVVEETEGMFGIYYQGQTAYVDSNLCFINLPEYMADMCSYNITNSYASLYMMHEFEIPEVTNVITAGYEDVQLGKNEYLVPLLYPTAKRLANAARTAIEKGYRLKIYDAFRPQEATLEIYELTESILDTPIPELPFTEKKTVEELNLPTPRKEIDPITGLEVIIPLTYREVMIVEPYKLNYFVAKGTSKHNYGIALDLTLEKLSNGKELEMQTSMHDLSHYSARDYNNSSAKSLSSIMKSAGFTTLVSEWWHFNDLESRDKFSAKPLKNGVNAKCWMVDDTGIRFRKSDGSYYKDRQTKIDGVTYTFDKEGYLVTTP